MKQDSINPDEDTYDLEQDQQDEKEAREAKERYFTTDWHQMSPDRGSHETDEDYEERMEDLDNL